MRHVHAQANVHRRIAFVAGTHLPHFSGASGSAANAHGDHALTRRETIAPTTMAIRFDGVVLISTPHHPGARAHRSVRMQPHPMVKSAMLVDRRQWVVTRCESAARDGFYGVDLTSATGEKVRIIPQPDESALVVLFPVGGGDVIRMSDCARSRMPRSNTKINNVQTMDGWATFSCDVSGRTIEGRVDFEMCH
jgi:hypothetical protein